MRTIPSRAAKIGYRWRASGRPRGSSLNGTPARALPPTPNTGSRIWISASCTEKSAMSPSPVARTCASSSSTTHTAWTAADSYSRNSGGSSGSVTSGSPDRASTVLSAACTSGVATQPARSPEVPKSVISTTTSRELRSRSRSAARSPVRGSSRRTTSAEAASSANSARPSAVSRSRVT